MNKNKMLKVVNPILAILLINQILMALLHDVIPHGLFEVLHGGGGYLLAVVALIHIRHAAKNNSPILLVFCSAFCVASKVTYNEYAPFDAP